MLRVQNLGTCRWSRQRRCCRFSTLCGDAWGFNYLQPPALRTVLRITAGAFSSVNHPTGGDILGERGWPLPYCTPYNTGTHLPTKKPNGPSYARSAHRTSPNGLNSWTTGFTLRKVMGNPLVGMTVGATMFVAGIAFCGFDAGLTSTAGAATFMAAVTGTEFVAVLGAAGTAATTAAAIAGDADSAAKEPESAVCGMVAGLVIGAIVLIMLLFVVHSVFNK